MVSLFKNLESESTMKTSTLSTAQSLSGLVFSSFSLLHISNHMIGTLEGFEQHKKWMRFFRQYYQFELIEPIILTSFGVHLTSSLWKLYRRKTIADKIENDKEKKSIRVFSAEQFGKVAHRFSGYFLAGVVGGHIYATRIGWYMLGEWSSDVDFATYSIQNIPFYSFYLYYFLLMTSGTYHSIFGIRQALLQLELVKPSTMNKILPNKPAVWHGLLATSMTCSALAVAFLGGHFHEFKISSGRLSFLENMSNKLYNIPNVIATYFSR